MAVHITPQMRAEQFSGELGLRSGKLWCIWCERSISHRRKDLIIEHLRSKVHQDSRIAKGQKMSYNLDSQEAVERRRKRNLKLAQSKIRRDSSRDRADIPLNTPAEEDGLLSLRKLFEESDSDSAASFEGFDSPPQKTSEKELLSSSEPEEDDFRRSGRPRKRPARLDDSIDHNDIAKIGKIADQAGFVGSMSRRRKTTDGYESLASRDLSPPARIRSMPIKKQISYSARHSDSTSPIASPSTGSLKMKFSRTSDTSASQEYKIKPEKNLKVVSKSGPGKALKLKFIWKKKQHSKKNGSDESKSTDSNVASSDFDDPNEYEEMVRGLESSFQGEAEATEDINEEIVEEEIVEMKEDEVLPEDLLQDHSFVENQENEISSSTSAKFKTHIAKTAQAGKLLPKKTKPKIRKSHPGDDKKRKTTGYMLWAKQMREKVSKQYPGLEFGDVSKKLGDLWKKMPDKEKQMWKFRNSKMELIQKSRISTTFRKSGSRMIETGPKKNPPPAKSHTSFAGPTVKNPEAAMKQELSRLPPPSIEPVDSAAYMSLLGESFNKLSTRTKKVESQIIIQGAETVLLDSLVCALAPLISLTRQIPELNDAIDPKTLSACFSNIAHIMPGL